MKTLHKQMKNVQKERKEAGMGGTNQLLFLICQQFEDQIKK
jgi:hypothetical protein